MKLHFRTPEIISSIQIGRDIAGSLKTIENAVVVADEIVQDQALMLGFPCLTLPGGEESKTRETKAKIEDFLFEQKCDRNTTLIAIGGGTITDVAAFAASTYLRGIPLVLVPTTLLAMVDAAIGGKTALNTPWKKNLLGSFYPAKTVVVDFRFLDKLPHNEMMNGMAEILKIGLVAERSILEDKMPDVIVKAIQTKIRIIEQDPLDRGIRKILHFGHTVAHALETLSNYQISHGEAVAIGSLMEAHISMSLGYLGKDDFETILDLYKPFSLRLPQGYTREQLINGMHQGKTISCVLIDRVGHAMEFEGKHCKTLNTNELINDMVWLENFFNPKF